MVKIYFKMQTSVPATMVPLIGCVVHTNGSSDNSTSLLRAGAAGAGIATLSDFTEPSSKSSLMK